MEPGVIERAASSLRDVRRDFIAAYRPTGAHDRIIHAIEDAAALWSDPDFAVRRKAQKNSGTFPMAMVQVSLDGLLPSLTTDRLRALIRTEAPDLSRSPSLVGHVIAGNTPLIGWTSVLRALLIGSASLVKAPSSGQGCWLEYLVQTLKIVAPEVAAMISVLFWRGGDERLDRALCGAVDRLAVYGNDRTVRAHEELAKGRVLGYGHRVSTAFVLKGADIRTAAKGLATDVLVYDQGGCLSPHTIFVEGDFACALEFGALLSEAMDESVFGHSAVSSSMVRASKVREARELCRFSDVDRSWEGDALRWTTIASPRIGFRISPTYGVVHVRPFVRERVFESLDIVKGKLQGAAIASRSEEDTFQFGVQLSQFGVFYTCAPGELQAPPFEWRQNGISVLRSLID